MNQSIERCELRRPRTVKVKPRPGATGPRRPCPKRSGGHTAGPQSSPVGNPRKCGTQICRPFSGRPFELLQSEASRLAGLWK
eukprot:1122431-Pyramimonas_sp.AAC.1